MAGDVKYTGQTYRLRAGAPMPIEGQGQFVLHTFMAEISDIDLYAYTESLPGSEQFRGQGGDYMSASFSRLAQLGGNAFSGRIIHNIEYVEEGSIG